MNIPFRPNPTIRSVLSDPTGTPNPEKMTMIDTKIADWSRLDWGSGKVEEMS